MKDLLYTSSFIETAIGKHTHIYMQLSIRKEKKINTQ